MSEAEREAEIHALMTSGVAGDHRQAEEILQKLAEKREKSDLVILYQDQDCSLVRYFFPDLMDEKPYNGSTIRVAILPSGCLDKARKQQPTDSVLALGKLMEFVSEDRQKARLVAWIDNFGYANKAGIFLSSSSAKEIHAREKETFDDRHDLYRIEFKPIASDHVFGMFYTWQHHPVNEQAFLVLYMPRSKVSEI